MDKLLRLLAVPTECEPYDTVISIVRSAVSIICYAIPVIIVVLIIIDVAKVATAGNVDEKAKKEVGQKAVTRLIYAVVIFLVPTIVKLIFGLISNDDMNSQTKESGKCHCSIMQIYLEECK